MHKTLLSWAGWIAFITSSVFTYQHSHAASLQASPVLVELRETSPSATVQIRNTGQAPINVQTRVFRWTQKNGSESLDETDDLAASPPLTTLQPGTSYSVRLVRTNRAPIKDEQAFRVLVDELPDPARQQSGTIAMVVRHSIPVFMMRNETRGGEIAWQVGTRNGRLVLRATNSGDRRVRLSAVSVKLASGASVNFGTGLLGYALAGSTMEWLSPQRITSGIGSDAMVNATTDQGAINAKASGLK
jgi:fimbrial chaperone protein